MAHSEITTPPLLEASNVTVRLGKRVVLRDVSLSLCANGCLGVIGPNGAGKTTLIRTLIGALPFEGQIRLDGVPLSTLSPRRRAQLISYVPQRCNVVVSTTVWSFLLLSRYPWVAPSPQRVSPEDEARAAAVVRQFGLEALTHRPLRTLSGGEQQRVMIAAACAQTPKILLLDEPSASLDPFYTGELLSQLISLREEMAIIFVSHDLMLTWTLAEHVVALRSGEVLACGSPQQLQEGRALQVLFGDNIRLLRDGEGRGFPVPAGVTRYRGPRL